MKPWGYRAAVPVALTPWIAAFFAPYVQPTYLCPHWAAASEPSNTGWILASWGWLGPLGGNFAWYANLLLVWMIARLLRGRPPGRRLSLSAFALSGTALLPAFILDFEQDGRFHCQMVSGPAVWLWIAAFAVIAVVAWTETSGSAIASVEPEGPSP